MKSNKPLKTQEVAGLSGVNEKTLHYWDKTGLLRPSVQQATGRGSTKLYSFSDSVAAASALRLKQAGVQGLALRKLVRHVSKRCRPEWVDRATVLVLDGKRVRELCDDGSCAGAGSLVHRYAVGLDAARVLGDVQRSYERQNQRVVNANKERG